MFRASIVTGLLAGIAMSGLLVISACQQSDQPPGQLPESREPKSGFDQPEPGQNQPQDPTSQQQRP